MTVPTPPSRLSLPIPRPWDLEQFRAALERHRSRTLLLQPASLPRGCAAAVCITTATADVIVYDQALGSQRQLHAIGHQLGHLVLGHQGRADRRSLFPHLDPALIVTSPLVSRYDEADELEADNFASLFVAGADATR